MSSVAESVVDDLPDGYSPTIYLPEKLVPFSDIKKRYKIAIGGRGSAKSQSIGDLCLRDSQVDGIKIGCFREFMNSIKDSVYSLLEDEIERLNLVGFDIKEREIKNSSGGQFTFRGMARNIMSIKSMHGYDRFWVEEAQTASAESLRILSPTLRSPDSEIWMSANPQSRADPFSQRFIVPYEKHLLRHGYYEDELHLIILINYMDNPMFPDILEKERQHDEETLSATMYAHIWLGRYNDEVDGSIIPVEWFNAAIDAHKKLGFQPVGQIIVAHDPSDEGADDKGLACRHGSVVTDVRAKDDGDINDGCTWATQYAIAAKADVFRWDIDGMGLGLKKQVGDELEGKYVDIEHFSGGSGVDFPDLLFDPDDRADSLTAKTNRQTFKNRRAQAYWLLRERFRHTYQAIEKHQYTDPEKLISISSDIDDIDQLRSEVCRIPKKYNPNGMIQIMSKEEMAKLKPPIPSPNMADALMMTMPVPINNACARARVTEESGSIVRRSASWKTL